MAIVKYDPAIVAASDIADKRELPVHNILHDFKNIVKSATHTHFGERCAEWVILQGDGESIKQFVERISAIKDVVICRCSV